MKTTLALASFETARAAEDINVQTRFDQSPHLPIWIASVATSLFCAAGVAAFMAWMPAAVGNPEDHATLAVPARPLGAEGDGTTCAECGVVESVQEIDPRGDQAAGSTRSYEVTIRLRDGSRRVFNQATSRTWRSGTEVKIID